MVMFLYNLHALVTILLVTDIALVCRLHKMEITNQSYQFILNIQSKLQ